MKKQYEKPKADWISFQIGEDLAREWQNGVGGSVSGDISGGFDSPRVQEDSSGISGVTNDRPY